ncbi:hypothetical protein HNR46_002197 [Haloferula luteola]|uniref:Uncharacterized protein n=1 Tax=Haloferula luteola TaxID=595692 RepID=A0A840VBA0_9BACT|nr:hypothetical protein [Haloferula luteola]MBB5351958.1 hypothetical protein [Haloferula luteola]
MTRLAGLDALAASVGFALFAAGFGERFVGEIELRSPSFHAVGGSLDPMMALGTGGFGRDVHGACWNVLRTLPYVLLNKEMGALGAAVIGIAAPGTFLAFGAWIGGLAAGTALAMGLSSVALTGYSIASQLSAGASTSDILRGVAVGFVSATLTAGWLHPLQEAATSASGLGTQTALKAAHVAGHGIIGGLSQEAMGGRFQDGVLGGAAGSASSWVPGIADVTAADGTIGSEIGVVGRTAVAGALGGTASVVGGGKFANGAYTAAFQHLLNAEGAALKRIFDVEGSYDSAKAELKIRVFHDGKSSEFSIVADTGGEYLSQSDFEKNGTAVPLGDYDLVPDPTPGRRGPGVGTWIALYAKDQQIDGYKMWMGWGKGLKYLISHNTMAGGAFGRGNFRLHLGSVSLGCVTCYNGSSDGRIGTYNRMAAAVSSSWLVSVPYWPDRPMGSQVSVYGTISVK